ISFIIGCFIIPSTHGLQIMFLCKGVLILSVRIGSGIHSITKPLVNYTISIAKVGRQFCLGILKIGYFHSLPEIISVIESESKISLDPKFIIKESGTNSNSISE